MATIWANASTHGDPTYDWSANPTYLYSLDGNYAVANPAGDIQDLGGFNFTTPPPGSGECYEVDAVHARLNGLATGFGTNVSIGIKLSWDGGTSWTSQYVLTWTNVEGQVQKTYSAAQSSSARLSWGRNWTFLETATANLRARLTFTRATGASWFWGDYFELGIDIHACRNVGGPGHYTHDTRIIAAA